MKIHFLLAAILALVPSSLESMDKKLKEAALKKIILSGDVQELQKRFTKKTFNKSDITKSIIDYVEKRKIDGNQKSAATILYNLIDVLEGNPFGHYYLAILAARKAAQEKDKPERKKATFKVPAVPKKDKAGKAPQKEIRKAHSALR